MDGLNPFGGSGADLRGLLRALLVAKMAQAGGIGPGDPSVQPGLAGPYSGPIYEDTTSVGNDMGMTTPNGGSIGPPTGGQENNPWGNYPAWTDFDPYSGGNLYDAFGGATTGDMRGSNIGAYTGPLGNFGPPTLGRGPGGLDLRSLQSRSAPGAGALGPLGIAARLIAASIANTGGRGFDTNVSPNSSRVGGSLMGRANTPGMLTNADRLNTARSRNLF